MTLDLPRRQFEDQQLEKTEVQIESAKVGNTITHSSLSLPDNSLQSGLDDSLKHFFQELRRITFSVYPYNDIAELKHLVIKINTENPPSPEEFLQMIISINANVELARPSNNGIFRSR